MANVQLISQPDPTRCHGKMEFCFTITEAETNRPSAAIVCLLFVDNDPIAVGTPFILAGQGFTSDANLDVNSGQDQSDFIAMLFNETFPFACDTVVEQNVFVINGVTSYQVCATWCNIGPVDNFVNTGLTQISSANGALADIIAGFRFLYQINKDFTQQHALILGADGFPTDICIYPKTKVQTSLPDCNLTGPQEDLTICSTIQIKYGYLQQDTVDNCGVEYGPFQRTVEHCYMNSVTQVGEVDNYSWPSVVEFMTHQPLTMKICQDACDWLWINLNYERATGFLNNYTVLYRYINENGAVISTEVVQIDTDGCYYIPTGPSQLNIPAGTCEYTVQIGVFDVNNPFGLNYSEVRRYILDPTACCEDGKTIYYRDSAGGFSRFVFNKILAIDWEDTAQEICIDTPCPTGETGPELFDIEAHERCIVTTAHLKKNSETLEWLKAFKSANRMYTLEEDQDGNRYWRKVTVAAGTTRIFLRDGRYFLTMTIQDSVPWQSV